MDSKMDTHGFKKRLTQLIGSELPFAWAARIGLPGATFSRMWKDGIPPRADHLLTIRRETGCSLDWLLTGDAAEQYRAVPQVRDATTTRQTGAVGPPAPPEETTEAGIEFFLQLARQKLAGKTPDEVADLIAEMRELFRRNEKGPDTSGP